LIDGGDCEIGIASTVADLRDPSKIIIHREGIIKLSDLENLKGDNPLHGDWLKRSTQRYRENGNEGPTL
jgi:hypothetical protein